MCHIPQGVLCAFAMCVAFGGLVGPAPAPRFGFNDNSAGFGIASARAVMARQSEIPAAANVHRFTVDWRNVEPTPGAHQWEPYDRIYAEALAHGLQPLPILLNAPRWAKGVAGACRPRGPRCISPPDRTPTAMGAWRAFVAAAVRRWPRSVAVEAWNEPNLRSFWTTAAGADAEHFGDLQCHAYRAVKATDPGMTVLLGGLANPVTGGGDVSLAAYLDALYRHGAARECNDALSLHPYPGQRAPDPPGSHFLAHLAQARAVIARHRDAGRRLWLTEFGYFTGRDPGFGPEHARPVSEDRQAEELVCAYRIAATMPDVDAFLVHTLFDPGISPWYREHHYGVARHPALGGQRKAAHRALTALFSEPGGPAPATRCR